MPSEAQNPRLGAECLQDLRKSNGSTLRPLVVAMGTRGDVTQHAGLDGFLGSWVPTDFPSRFVSWSKLQGRPIWAMAMVKGGHVHTRVYYFLIY